MHHPLGQDFEVSAIGLGCMGMSEFYGPRDDEVSMRVLHEASDLGIDFFDTAMYGPHHNEELIGAFLRSPGPVRRSRPSSASSVRRANTGAASTTARTTRRRPAKRR